MRTARNSVAGYDERSLLVTYAEAAQIVGGTDVLNAHIANGLLKPTRVNDRPGAPSLFPRSMVERLARGKQRW
jgi:hypothetical protein